MDPVYRATSDVYVLPTTLPIPGAGALVVNAYLILAAQPVLVDTGLAVVCRGVRARGAVDH